METHTGDQDRGVEMILTIGCIVFLMVSALWFIWDSTEMRERKNAWRRRAWGYQQELQKWKPERDPDTGRFR
jgi:hypothetical protein